MISIAMCLPKYLSCQGDSLSVSNQDNVDETELRKYSLNKTFSLLRQTFGLLRDTFGPYRSFIFCKN
ncbi:MAG: hypothetical protein H6Q14_150 [Bacteroidetes bacterium]|nr:hypothetical protein [Bacteroidota bacterium]